MFAGYVVKPGYRWTGEYFVWDLADFAPISLHVSTTSADIPTTLKRPHITARAMLFSNDLVFPLKDGYDKANSTLEGIRAAAESRNPYACPPHADEHHRGHPINRVKQLMP